MNTETPIASATNRLLPEKDCYGTLELAGELSRLCKIRNAVYEYWRGKNAAKSKPRYSRNGHH